MPEPLSRSYRPPSDGYAGTLVGRAWVPDGIAGPAVVVVTADGVFDICTACATTSALFDLPDPAGFVRAAPRHRRLGSVEELIANSDPDRRDPGRPWLLAPIDLQ